MLMSSMSSRNGRISWLQVSLFADGMWIFSANLVFFKVVHSQFPILILAWHREDEHFGEGSSAKLCLLVLSDPYTEKDVFRVAKGCTSPHFLGLCLWLFHTVLPGSADVELYFRILAECCHLHSISGGRNLSICHGWPFRYFADSVLYCAEGIGPSKAQGEGQESRKAIWKSQQVWQSSRSGKCLPGSERDGDQESKLRWITGLQQSHGQSPCKVDFNQGEARGKASSSWAKESCWGAFLEGSGCFKSSSRCPCSTSRALQKPRGTAERKTGGQKSSCQWEE